MPHFESLTDAKELQKAPVQLQMNQVISSLKQLIVYTSYMISINIERLSSRFVSSRKMTKLCFIAGYVLTKGTAWACHWNYLFLLLCIPL